MNEYHQFILNSASTIIKQDNEANLTDPTNISETCKRAQRITAAWQMKCQQEYNSLLISSDKENIMYFGIWDAKQGIIYELRVSIKNPRNHFFKTICKIIAYNGLETSSHAKINTINYLIPLQVKKELIKGFPKNLMEVMLRIYGITVNITPITS